jgi:hypothetical protein
LQSKFRGQEREARVGSRSRLRGGRNSATLFDRLNA